MISGSGRSPGEGNGCPLQYSGLENSTDRGAWWATVLGVPKSDQQRHTCLFPCRSPRAVRSPVTVIHAHPGGPGLHRCSLLRSAGWQTPTEASLQAHSEDLTVNVHEELIFKDSPCIWISHSQGPPPENLTIREATPHPSLSRQTTGQPYHHTHQPTMVSLSVRALDRRS